MNATVDPCCEYCCQVLSDEEAASPHQDDAGDVMCDECYSEHYEYLCPLCQDLVETDSNQEHIVVTPALAEQQEMEPGIYRVTELPWFSSDYFSMTVHQHALTRVADLPAALSDMVCGDYVCEHCVRKHAVGAATSATPTSER
jgi:hypothetical protein